MANCSTNRKALFAAMASPMILAAFLALQPLGRPHQAGAFTHHPAAVDVSRLCLQSPPQLPGIVGKRCYAVTLSGQSQYTAPERFGYELQSVSPFGGVDQVPGAIVYGCTTNVARTPNSTAIIPPAMPVCVSLGSYFGHFELYVQYMSKTSKDAVYYQNSSLSIEAPPGSSGKLDTIPGVGESRYRWILSRPISANSESPNGWKVAGPGPLFTIAVPRSAAGARNVRFVWFRGDGGTFHGQFDVRGLYRPVMPSRQ